MSVRDRVGAAVQRMLYPVVKILLEYGVTESDFQKLARAVFVKVAAEQIDFSTHKSGSRVSQARIAVMTGVPRGAIKEILEAETTVIAQDEWYRHRCAAVLSEWHNNPDYIDDRGQPISIPFYGDAPSFVSLCARTSQGLSVHAICDELRQVGAIEVADEDSQHSDDANFMLIAKEKIFRRHGSKIEDLESIADSLYNLASTQYVVNIKGEKSLAFGDHVSHSIDPSKMPVLFNRLRNAGYSFIRSGQGIVNMRELSTEESNDESAGQRAGFGFYVYGPDHMAVSEYFSNVLIEREKDQASNE